MSQWRSRTFHLTRNREFIAKTALGILAAFALLATVVHVALDEPTVVKPRGHADWTVEGAGEHFLEGYKTLLKSNKPEPARLARWMRDSPDLWNALRVLRRIPFQDGEDLKLGNADLPALFRKHATSEDQRLAFISYARSQSETNAQAKTTAMRELEQLARGAESPRHANELLADLLKSEGRHAEALKALLREGRHAGAWDARIESFNLALDLKDAETLGMLSEDHELRERVEPMSLWSAARLTHDRQLLLEALWRVQWHRWMHSFAVPLALLAAAIWYIILVYTASRERWRWVRYIPALVAGVASVALLHWLQGTLQYGQPQVAGALSPTHEMIDWILKVGLPEEAVKLALFCVFLPVLLHRGSAAKAALTAGLVGLGFALDENLTYFKGDIGSAALIRLLGANFLHVALTGILGCSLYELFRSKFHRATEFLTAFLGVVVAHGLYDFCFSPIMVQWELTIMHVIILAVTARFYLHLLVSPTDKPAGWVISRTAMFTFGLAFLIGVLMVVTTWNLGTLKGITLTLQNALGVATVAYFYVREFNEV